MITNEKRRTIESHLVKFFAIRTVQTNEITDSSDKNIRTGSLLL
jgi:hypothetical protein